MLLSSPRRRVEQRLSVSRRRRPVSTTRRTGVRPMSHFDRRQFLVGTAATATVALTGRRVKAQTKGATLRFIPHADLKVLDPIWTTAYITRNHSYMIYDTLFGTDEKLQIKPQMIERWGSTDKGLRWSFTLRDGLKF